MKKVTGKSTSATTEEDDAKQNEHGTVNEIPR